jgi:hypothetical protein
MGGNDPYARGPAPSLIAYGRAPGPRYVTTVPAQPLTVGCYRAAIGGTGWVTFQIKSDGTIAETAYGY